MSVHDIYTAFPHQTADCAHHTPRWPSPTLRNLDMLELHPPHPLHKRARFRQHDHLVPALADRARKL
ncbi:hypothetical protein J2S34_003592 [Nitrobacter winogradskyi]|uniref:Uncharacterized protein n=2 Tax=Nitrobacter winogradskyi TaxID=913 RepID=A0ACC6AN82_NITWI|nr:hypothetical protein [Nitrobacter winogradskyi]GEC16838.1 hypothetical protein NWI01_27300 [Nitrobacter winogradskyi]